MNTGDCHYNNIEDINMNLVQDTLRGVFKFNRGQADKGIMQKQKGFSLTEILVGVGILGIMGSIATVSYRGYILDVTKKTLKDSGTLFQVAVNTCVRGKGGWEIKRYRQSTDQACPSGETDPCIKTYPCKATTTEELKKKLNYTCPAKATCSTYEKIDTAERHRYYCLSIEREVSGKNIQILVRVQKDNPSTHEILCNDNLSSYVKLGPGTCKEGYTSDGITDKDGNQINDKHGNRIRKLNEILKKCEW